MTKLMMNQFQKRNQFHIRNRFLQRNRFLLKTIPFAKGIDSFKKCQKWPKNRNRDSFGIGIDTALDIILSGADGVLSPSSAGASPRLLFPRMSSSGVSLHPGGLERGTKRRQHHRRRFVAKRTTAHSSDSGKIHV